MAFTDHHYFVDGLLRDADNIAVSAAFREDEDQSSSEVWIQNGQKWIRIKFEDDLVCSIAFDETSNRLVAIGKHGRTLVCTVPPGDLDPAQVKQTVVRSKIENAVRHGPLTRVRWLDGHALACGWRGQMYSLSDAGWTAVDEGLPNGVEGNLVDVAIDGDGVVHAVGMRGSCYRVEQRHWSRVDVPTSAHLYCATTSSTGDLYVGGANGVLLRGRGDEWNVLDGLDFEQNIWDVREYRGKLWIAAGDSYLGYLDKDGLIEVEPRVGEPTKSHRLDRLDDLLFACGPQHLNIFDGRHWNEVILPKPKRDAA